MRVPELQAPQIQSGGNARELVGAIGQAAGAYDQKQREDATVWTGSQMAAARKKWTERVSAARESGEINDGFAGQIDDEMAADAQELLKAAPNDYAKRSLEAGFQGLQGDMFQRSMSYEADARITRRVGQTEKMLNDWGNVIATDPGQFKAGWEETGAVISSLKVPTEVKQKLDLARRGLAENALNTMSEKAPGRVISELDSGAWNDYLDADRRKVIYNSAQSNQKRLISDAKAAQAMQRAELAQDAADLALSDIQSRRLTGKAVDDPQAQAVIKAGFTPRQYEKYQAAVSKADTIFQATGDMRKLPTAELFATVEKLKPQGGEEDFADRMAAYSEAAKIASDVLNDRKKDPGASVRESFTNVMQRWQNYEANPHPAHLRDALKASKAAQDSLGIPENQQRLMPANMARGIAQQIASAPPDQAHKALQQQAEAFGPYWSKAFRQMSKVLDPNTKVAAIIDDPGSASLLIATSRQDPAKLRKSLDVPSSGDKSITNMIASDDRMRDFRASASQLPGGGKNADDLYSATEVLALGYMQSRGMNAGEATEAAIKATLDDKYQFGYTNSRPFHVQRGRDVRKVEAGAKHALETLTPDGLSVGGPPGSLSQENAAAVVSAIKRNGYWATNHGATGLILFNERGAPVLKNGKPIEMKWEQLERVKAPTDDEFDGRIPGVN